MRVHAFNKAYHSKEAMQQYIKHKSHPPLLCRSCRCLRCSAKLRGDGNGHL